MRLLPVREQPFLPGGAMITSSSNQRVKQVIQWQTKARERKSAGVFLTEGFKMFEEAPAEAVREVYLSENVLERCQQEKKR